MLRAMNAESSELPLSAIMISPAISLSRSARCAFSMQTRSVSASFKQGITTETSIMDKSSSACAVWNVSMHSIRSELTVNRSEEHTSELQSPYDLVCRLQLEKK